ISPPALSPPKRVESPPLLLRRTSTQVRTQRPRKPSLEPEPLALLSRFRRLLVERRGDFRRSAAVGEARDDDGAARRPEADLERVARRDLARRLAAFAAEPDVTCEDELGCRAPRLRKARRPQPLVDAYAIHGFTRS